MKKITSRNFSILCDFMDIYQFMIDIYEKDWRKYQNAVGKDLTTKRKKVFGMVILNTSTIC